MPTKQQLLIQQIEDLELQLENLKLELKEAEATGLQIGDKVQILNPKRGQPTRGRIHKLHPNSQRATVLTRIYVKNEDDKEIKTVRMFKNLEKE